MSRRYRGQRLGDAVVVTVEEETERGFGNARPLPLRLELRNHSPTGYEWGYSGSGPAQLALAIVADALSVPPNTKEPRLWNDDVDPRVRRALAAYQHFKNDHVARWPRGGWWILDEDVVRCIERCESEERA